MQSPLESQYDVRMSGKFLLIYICKFHVLSQLLLIYICNLHWKWPKEVQTLAADFLTDPYQVKRAIIFLIFICNFPCLK